ncbi:MAG TPA: rod shape-determining protein MreD [Tepidisphaeraceae bacterium]|nr:rod shape-determining protein MreD [Tepidisphaeraceae bacterium]
MRWLTFAIFAYLTVALQIGLGPFVGYHGATPNLVLLAAVFIALYAPRDAALLGCFVLGALQDMVTIQQPGLYALSYGLVALFVTGTQQMVYRDHPLTHFSLALVGGLVTEFILVLHGYIHPPAARMGDVHIVLPAIRLSATTLLIGALYTAILAPIAFAPLQRTKPWFGFQPGRRKMRFW